ncbi:right-handed parallel beta-helix repeat-containing protein [Microbacterium testaceum]|uniref:right-handed parallel beta-helix repeat-containing protein n=1 Tax=Microbacterium testaceum TaxID=2033 RepID=UPI000734308C|nr:right-handed parallel beta-helix repeat-containing protein [Microbacterium testaceum]
MTDEGGITAHERGDSHFAFRGVVRVVMVVAVVVLVAGVILAGNFIHTGTFLPWLSNDARSSTAVVGPVPDPTESAAEGASDAAAPQTPADRVAAEDTRLSAVAALGSTDPALIDTWSTVVLGAKNGQPTGYSLADLVALGAARQDDATTFTLLRNVVVRSGAELDLVAPGSTLRMTSSPAGSTSIVGWGGHLLFGGLEGSPLRITSWDDSNAAPDTDESDGRAYVRVRDGILASSYTDFSDLGYWSGRTGGLAITGSGTVDAGARLENSTMTGLHYGLFASESTGVGVFDSTITDSTLTGLEFTNGGHDFRVDRTTVRDSGSDGISLSRQSRALTLSVVTVEGAAGWGVRVDGSALADGPTTGGYGLTPSSGFTLTDSRVQNNRDGGVRVISTDDTEIHQSTVDETRTAVLVEGPSTGLSVTNADLSSSELRGLDINGRITDAKVSDSRIVGRRIATELTGASVVMSGNDLSVTTGSAIELADGARADITGNTFHGVGQDAVAMWSDSRTMQADNDESGWTFQWAWVGWMNEHPMMWMWALVLLIPAIGLPVLWRRRREHQRLRELLREALLRHGEEQVAAYRALPAAETVTAPAGVPVPVAAMAPAAASAESGGESGGPMRDAPHGVPPRPRAPRAPATARPRSFADLRTGALEGRTFASLREFAIAAVIEGGYSVPTISRLFRIQQWRLQQWVDDALLMHAPPVKEQR